MNVLCFIPALAAGKGGAERVVVEMAEALTRRGHKMTLIGHAKTPDSKPAYSISEEVQWALIDHNEIAIREQIQRTNPDVIFAVTAMAAMRFWSAAFRGINIPVVIHEASSPQRITRLWGEHLNLSLEQAALQRHAYLADVTKIRVTMPSYRDSLPPHLREDVFAFGNAVKFARRRAAVNEGRRKTIINVGGLKPNKNIWPVLEAFRNLCTRFPEWEMVICGEGKLRDDVTRFIADAALQDRILLLGDVDDMYSVYERCHLHIIGSLEEGNPLAVCESMVHGLPSIGYADCAGTNEHIRHGKNGLLAGTANRTQDLQKCMEVLMSNGRMRKQFGDQAFKDSAVFDGKAIYDTWEQMFRAAYAYCDDRQRKLEERAALQPQLERLYSLIREKPSRIKDVDFVSELKAIYEKAGAQILTTSSDKQTSKAPTALQQIRRIHRFRTWIFAIRHLGVVRSSSLFDSEYYKKNNPDVALATLDPAKHYYFYGGYEGRNPSAKFDSAAYLDKYPDVHAQQINPLVHFELFGQYEGRTPR